MLERKGISTDAAADDIAVYAEGVRVMRERSRRDPMDPLGWEYQSRIHGNPFGTEREPDEPEDWSSCQHGSWFFLPWHRMSLLQFERIIQFVTGESEWALPYWDYPDASSVTIPDAFLDESSALFQPGRRFRRPRDLPAPTWQNSGSFTAFGGGARDRPAHIGEDPGSLELNPHNPVHGIVGGDMASFQSPLDPLFYIHHCAIDRFWEVWLTLGGRNPDKDSWLETSFDFPDPEGPTGRRTLRVRAVKTTADAGYSYDDLTPPPSTRERRLTLPEMTPGGRRKDEDLELLGATSGGGTVRDRAEIGVFPDVLERRRSILREGAEAAEAVARLPLFLRLENVGVDAGDASSMWNVYVRSGREGERHLAGTIAPFGLAGLTAAGGRQTLTMDISHLSDELVGATEPLEVTFESVYDDPEGEPFYERAALYTTSE